MLPVRFMHFGNSCRYYLRILCLSSRVRRFGMFCTFHLFAGSHQAVLLLYRIFLCQCISWFRFSFSSNRCCHPIPRNNFFRVYQFYFACKIYESSIYVDSTFDNAGSSWYTQQCLLKCEVMFRLSNYAIHNQAVDRSIINLSLLGRYSKFMKLPFNFFGLCSLDYGTSLT